MTDNASETKLRQRKGSETIPEEADTEKEINKTEEKEEETRSTWQSVKYYFNRFRYYHFIVADTIDKYASAACLWLINMYFKLFMGVGSEPPSVLTQAE